MKCLAEKETLLAELKENYRKMREDIGEARMSHEQKVSVFRANGGGERIGGWQCGTKPRA